MNLIESLNWRYATKVFDASKKLNDEQLHAIKESLRLSTSSFGLQPWKFVIVENPEIRQELVAHSWNQKQVSEASHLIVMCIPSEFGKNEVEAFVEDIKETRGVDQESVQGYSDMMNGFLSSKTPEWIEAWMRNQVYISMGHLLTACAVLGVDSCPMEGFSPKEYNRILGLTDKGLKSVLVCPIGFRSSEDKYSELAKVRFSEDKVFLTI